MVTTGKAGGIKKRLYLEIRPRSGGGGEGMGTGVQRGPFCASPLPGHHICLICLYINHNCIIILIIFPKVTCLCIVLNRLNQSTAIFGVEEYSIQTIRGCTLRPQYCNLIHCTTHLPHYLKPLAHGPIK